MSPRHIGLLAALSAVWGGSYLLIKYGLEEPSQGSLLGPGALDRPPAEAVALFDKPLAG